MGVRKWPGPYSRCGFCGVRLNPYHRPWTFGNDCHGWKHGGYLHLDCAHIVFAHVEAATIDQEWKEMNFRR